MNKKKIEAEYKKKIKKINQLNIFYYDQSNPLVTDDEYDKLKNEILLLEANNDFLKSEISPSQTIGHKPSKNFQKLNIEHQCYHLRMLLPKMI